MNKLWVPLVVSLIFAFLIQYRDKHIHMTTSNCDSHDKLFTLLLILYLGVFCGLRIRYNDTTTYIHIYEQTPSLKGLLSLNTLSFAQGAGFSILNAVMKSLKFSSQDFLMFYAIITAFCYVRFVRKHAPNFPLAVFLMFSTGFYTFSFAACQVE